LTSSYDGRVITTTSLVASPDTESLDFTISGGGRKHSTRQRSIRMKMSAYWPVQTWKERASFAEAGCPLNAVEAENR